MFHRRCRIFSKPSSFMKPLCLGILLLIYSGTKAQSPLEDTTVLTPVEVAAVRASDKTPVAKNNLSKKEIEKLNTGQDLPFVLQYLPSVVINSDAGNGFGYTGIRIRGTDATRINVTLNGIPYNDPESQGTFFVDIPDFSSSAGSIQVQRGLGTSTYGTGSFGGSINISTNEINRKPQTQILTTAGSYGSLRSAVVYNSGIFWKNFLIDGRVSRISSDGYIDRATSDLVAGRWRLSTTCWRTLWWMWCTWRSPITCSRLSHRKCWRQANML